MVTAWEHSPPLGDIRPSFFVGALLRSRYTLVILPACPRAVEPQWLRGRFPRRANFAAFCSCGCALRQGCATSAKRPWASARPAAVPKVPARGMILGGSSGGKADMKRETFCAVRRISGVPVAADAALPRGVGLPCDAHEERGDDWKEPWRLAEAVAAAAVATFGAGATAGGAARGPDSSSPRTAPGKQPSGCCSSAGLAELSLAGAPSSGASASASASA
eukprot:CAMPEP_0115418452 /NCGR_PEP_ID=MMETSP0271-20121206/24672_1 /TAXON_ID=71861 /ORGANISM="Scrippsiella trochoidea, Strain CCMP3099" /LENGTH=219 /DNA_ID=CAMNT_0002842921 /DNA_START=480 /DNA_END=1136 /DNA_ORIENTATION=-